MTKLTAGVAAVLLALVVTGCGNSDDGGGSTSSDTNTTSTTSEAAGGNEDAVAWADKVCSGIKDDLGNLTTQPQLDTSNPQAAKDGLITYLTSLETSLDGMVSAVEEAGTPPVDGGEDAVKGFTDQLTSAKESVTSAKTKIEAAPVNDPAAFGAAVTSAQSDLTKLTEMEDPTASFSENEALNDAYNEAPACKELESAGSSSTPTS